MAFGISFGANKSSGKSTTDVNKTETTNQTETGTKATTGTVTNTGATQTQQQTQQSQVGSTSGETSGSQTTQSTSQQFSDSVLGGLESAVGQLLGAIPTTPAAMSGTFDHDAFVKSGMDAASSQVRDQLETSLNSMFDQFGGRDDSNSMAMLLANRARGDAGSAMAGAYSNLEAQAQGIDRERFLANLQGTGQSQQFLAQVLDSLKGGRATQSAATQTAEATTGETRQAGSSATSGSETTQSQQVTDLVEALSQILAGTTSTAGTEHTSTSGKNMGGGVGLSI